MRPAVLVETVVLVAVMDVLLSAGHALAHPRRTFPLAHRLHHVFADPRPITVFAPYRWIATPTMHAGRGTRYHLGFYTTVWDRLFGTLEPGYDARRCAAVPEPYAGLRHGR